MKFLKVGIKKLSTWLSVNKYYEMSNTELEQEAAKWHIGEYSFGGTRPISRKIIIEQLIEKDKANNSRIAIVISVLATLLSIIALVVKI